MTDKQPAIDVTKRFIEMEHENRALKTVLLKYWKHETDPEDFVRKGVQQLQAREKEDRGERYLESAFAVATDDAALIRILKEQTLGRVKVD